MDLFGNAIFYYEGCEVKEGKRAASKAKQRQGEMTKMMTKLCQKEKDDNYLNFCLFDVNSPKN
jgi:hypothetical protein